MSRYARMFDRLGDRGEAALGAFVMLGDPAAGADPLAALVAAGADMVEVGIPFSDPVADGPVIQAAAQRALAAGVRVANCFGTIARFRARHPDVPVGILTYANLAVARGRDVFLRAAAAAGADSLLLADVPAFEAEPWTRAMQAAGIEAVLIAAANTPAATLRRISRLSAAYTYCVSRAGITGVHAAGQFDASLVERLGQAGAPPPVFGFGISRPEHVEQARAAGAAGVICGSAIVDLLAKRGDAASFVRSLKQATRERLTHGMN